LNCEASSIIIHKTFVLICLRDVSRKNHSNAPHAGVKQSAGIQNHGLHSPLRHPCRPRSAPPDGAFGRASVLQRHSPEGAHKIQAPPLTIYSPAEASQAIAPKAPRPVIPRQQ
jgi:hypothetical protein